MNPALALIAAILLITVAAMWWLLRPLLARRADAGTVNTSSIAAATSDAARTNIDALRVELGEARRDHQLGLLSTANLAEAERELEARVLAEAAVPQAASASRYPRTALTLGIALPVLAVGGYLALGSPAAALPEVVRAPAPASTANAAADGNGEAQMNELFRLAEERLQQNPGDLKGWLLLARAKSSVGRFAEALDAYAKAVALAADDADVWADYADAAAGLAQGRMDGRPIQLIQKALALDPRHPKALLLRGTWEIQQNQLATAEKTFTLARSLVEPNSGFAQIADNALNDIKARSGTAGASAQPVTAAATAPLASLHLQLSPEARRAATAASAVFVIVRAAGTDRGPPLAAKRIDLAALDQPVTLSAADAMIGGAGLKDGAEVTLVARLSQSGQPGAASGDWQSGKETVRLPVTRKLLIDQRVAP